MSAPQLPIPIGAAKSIAETFNYDQVVILARRVGEEPDPNGEHVTTYGVSTEHCRVAALMGDKLKEICGWPAEGLPWSDLKVAFDWTPPYNDDDPEDFGGLGLLMKQAWPEGWEITEVDGSGARYVAVFRVEGMPAIREAQAVEAKLLQLELAGAA